MPSEQRLIRPFTGVEGFASALSGANVRLGPARIEDGQRLNLPSSSLQHDPPVLSWGKGLGGEDLRQLLLAACDRAELEPESVELLVVVSTPYLRIADVALQANVAQIRAIPDELDLRRADPRPRALSTPVGGCDIEVYACLSTARPRQPLKPSRKGTWLGRARFSIRTELGELGLSPIPLTSEKRTELGLGPSTSRFVRIEDPDELLSERLDEAIALYVDDGVLASVAKSPTTPAARTFQRQLFLDVISAIVVACAQWDRFRQLTVADLEGSALGALVIAASGAKAGQDGAEAMWDASLDTLRTEPARFVALIDDQIAPIDDLRAALGGVDE